MGLHQQIEMTCKGEDCGQVFLTTGRNRLGLCPECRVKRRAGLAAAMYAAKKAVAARTKTARVTDMCPSTRATARMLEEPDEGFGPAHGFASLGSKRGQ
jgi:hypothetical protein